jgi:hypothetical protein
MIMGGLSVAEDRSSGVWNVTLHGLVTRTGAVSVAAAVDKCLTECGPAAIVVELRRAVFDTVTLSLPCAWYRRADEAGSRWSTWPGVSWPAVWSPVRLSTT